jgi:FkbM family methyltransferase
MNRSVIFLKKIFRNVYYFFLNGRVVSINTPEVIHGTKWIINKSYGRAYHRGYYEKKITKTIINNLNEDSVFIDIGAHAGYFSLIAAYMAKKGRVISFEPMPENCSFINKIKKLNQVRNWDVHEMAVSNFTGLSGFSYGQTSSTGTVLTNDHEGFKVKTITLDDFIHKNSIFPDFIKIDVEGHGDKVLEGFSMLITYPKRIQILMEIHENSNEMNYLFECLLDKGLSIRDLNNKKINHKSGIYPTHVLISNAVKSASKIK